MIIYIEQDIKDRYERLYNYLLDEAVQFNFEIVHDYEVVSSEIKRPVVLIVDDQFQLFSSKENQLSICLPNQNLNIFGLSNHDRFDLIVNDLNIEFLGLVLKSFYFSQNRLKTFQLINDSAKFFKEVFSKKNRILIKEYNLPDELEEIIFQDLDFNDWLVHINDFFDKNLYKVRVKRLNSFIPKGDSFYFHLGFIEFESYFLECHSSENKELILSLCYFLSQFFSDYRDVKELKWNNILITKALNVLDFPIIVFDQNNQIFFQSDCSSNLAFSASEIKDLRNDKIVKISNENYHVFKYTYKNLSILLLAKVEGDGILSATDSNEELGIISSSIAHELNNPLAGILAAIQVLMLDDLEEEIEQSLIQMKESVSRCQKLVQTFLGFSRKDDLLVKNKKFFIIDIFEQSIELIKFRLIENNLKLNYVIKGDKDHLFNQNPYVFTMMIYLLLNDIITQNSHDSLIHRKELLDNIQFEITVASHKISMKFVNLPFLYKDDIKQSKLFTHMLETVGWDILKEKNTISFYKC